MQRIGDFAISSLCLNVFQRLIHKQGKEKVLGKIFFSICWIIVTFKTTKPNIKVLSDTTIYFHRSSFSICLKNDLHSASIIFCYTLHSIERSVLSVYLFTLLFLFHTTERFFLLHSLCNVMKYSMEIYSKKETKF